MEIGKEYKIAPSAKLWDVATMKSAEITISKASKAYPAGTILSDNAGTFTAVTSALEHTCYIVVEDVAQNATKARVMVTGVAYLEALNAVNSTSFDMTKVLAANWAGTVTVLDRKEVAYAN